MEKKQREDKSGKKVTFTAAPSLKEVREELLKQNYKYDLLTSVYSPSLGVSSNALMTGIINETPFNQCSVSKRIQDNSAILQPQSNVPNLD